MTSPQLTASAALPRAEPDLLAGESDSLAQWLDYHRVTLQLKCDGLSEEQLRRRPLPPSTLSLLGLLRHLTEVELGWFVETLAGRTVHYPYSSDDEPEADLNALDSHSAADVLSRYRAAVAESRSVLASFASLDELRRADDDRPRNVRWVMAHMIEEYARHNGHADLLREALDGTVGE